MSVRDAWSPQRLWRLAGEPSYTRGEDYAEQRAVGLAALNDSDNQRWPRGNSVLVAILLREGDAVDVYRRLLSASLDSRNDSGYEAAIELLGELDALLAPHGHDDAHGALVDELRQAHRRKTNLIKRIDAREWAGGQ
jgi:uncharacterized Zn finger protein